MAASWRTGYSCPARDQPGGYSWHACGGWYFTARGGMTSHAAVVARGMGRACVSGASDVSFDESTGKVFIADKILVEGDIITIDGSNGVYAMVVLRQFSRKCPVLLLK